LEAWGEVLGCAVMGDCKIGGAGQDRQNQGEAMREGISIELGLKGLKQDEAE